MAADAGSTSGRGIASAAVVGYQLLVRRRLAGGGVGAPEPFEVRGISWSPAARGENLPDPAAYQRAAARDLPLMRAAHINAVKTYLPPTRATLDQLLAHDMFAIVTVFARADEDVEGSVNALKDHPALLLWVVGNEWNMNRLYGTCAPDACAARVEAAVRRIKALDPDHPVATSFAPSAEIPSDEELRAVPSVDLWGLNVYSQPGFYQRFASWRLAMMRLGQRKPFLMTEYGADAYDNRSARVDEAAQAQALRRQAAEIRGQSSAGNAALPCVGGTPFEWNDEWWKSGNLARQDAGGFANQGVAADLFANEEWWGIVDIDRKPRAAYHALREVYAP